MPFRWIIGKGPTRETVALTIIDDAGNRSQLVLPKTELADIANSLREFAQIEPAIAASIIDIEQPPTS